MCGLIHKHMKSGMRPFPCHIVLVRLLMDSEGAVMLMVFFRFLATRIPAAARVDYEEDMPQMQNTARLALVKILAMDREHMSRLPDGSGYGEVLLYWHYVHLLF